jgi:hypothetical protein
MTELPEARGIPASLAIGTVGRQILLALITIALVLAALGLAIVGLDAFNDLLARGFSSLSNPTG